MSKITINGKTYRNQPEQIVENANNINELDASFEEVLENVTDLATNVSGYDSRIESVETTVAGYNESISTATTNANNALNVANSLDSRVSSLESDNTSTKSDINTLKTDVDNVEESLNTLTSSVSTNTTNITSLQNQANTTDSNISSATSRISTLETNVATNTSDISSLNTSVSTNTSNITSLTTRVTTAESNITSLTSRISEVESDVSTLESDNTTNKTDISSIKSDISNIELELDNIKSLIDELDSSGDINTGNISTISEKLTELEQDIETLTTALTTLTSTVSTNTSDISSLTTRVSNTESDIDTLESNVSSLQSSVSTNTSNISSLTTRVDSAESDIDTLESNVSNLQSSVNTNSTNISSLESAVDTLEEFRIAAKYQVKSSSSDSGYHYYKLFTCQETSSSSDIIEIKGTLGSWELNEQFFIDIVQGRSLTWKGYKQYTTVSSEPRADLLFYDNGNSTYSLYLRVKTLWAANLYVINKPINDSHIIELNETLPSPTIDEPSGTVIWQLSTDTSLFDMSKDYATSSDLSSVSSRVTTIENNYTTLDEVKNLLLESVYPVGSVYMSFNNTSPASFLGGTWTQLSNTFLYASTEASNTTGGSSTSTLSVNNLPSHAHTINVRTSLTGTDDGTEGYVVSGVNSASDGSNWATRGVGETSSTGAGAAFSIMPPYTTVYMWRRTA